MLYTPFKNLRLSVRQCFVFTLGSIFLPIFFKLGTRGDIGKECLGIADGIGTELWPLIDVRNCFLLCIFGIFLPIFFKLCMRVDIGKECLGIADGYISSNNYRVMVLD